MKTKYCQPCVMEETVSHKPIKFTNLFSYLIDMA